MESLKLKALETSHFLKHQFFLDLYLIYLVFFFNFCFWIFCFGHSLACAQIVFVILPVVLFVLQVALTLIKLNRKPHRNASRSYVIIQDGGICVATLILAEARHGEKKVPVPLCFGVFHCSRWWLLIALRV